MSFNVILSIWLALTSLLSSIQSNNQTQILLQNVPIQDERLLVVNVYVTNLTDLYGAEVQLSYDPTQLSVRDDNRRLEGTQISPGPLLASADRFVVTNAANPETGLINFVFTLLKPAPPINGEGVLATVVFEIEGNGPYSVEVANAQFVSSQLEAIPLTSQNLQLNQALESVSPMPTTTAAPAAYWPWALGIGLLGLLAMAVALLFIYHKPATQTASSSSPLRMPQSPRSTLRSAALLAEQGQLARNQGDMQRAYELFSRAIELDPANVEAWLGKGLVAQQDTEKIICLQRVLALDPDNKVAKQEFERLRLR